MKLFCMKLKCSFACLGLISTVIYIFCKILQVRCVTTRRPTCFSPLLALLDEVIGLRLRYTLSAGSSKYV